MTQDYSQVLNNKDIWQKVLPEFSISDDILTVEPIPLLPQATVDHLMAIFKEEGVLQLDGILPASLTQKLESGIRTLRQKGIHPIFAFIYDDYWKALKMLLPIMTQLFGPDIMIMPDIWAWMIDKGKKNSGWPIHRDLLNIQLTKDGRPNIINLWIPLVDVDPFNSCMYIVPLNLDQNYPDTLDDYTFNAENCRALPAPAGSALFWSSNALHWGSRSTPHAKTERISYAFYLQCEGTPLNNPIITLTHPFPFKDRLRYIATQILDYSRDPFADFIYDWAKTIRFDKTQSDPSMY
jgi:hypothetical protein